ncbi:hypothetical protein ACLOJK_008802 [Asimina triloba]
MRKIEGDGSTKMVDRDREKPEEAEWEVGRERLTEKEMIERGSRPTVRGREFERGSESGQCELEGGRSNGKEINGERDDRERQQTDSEREGD